MCGILRMLPLLIMFCFTSCQTQLEKPSKKNSLSGNTQSVHRNEKNKGMSNPLLLSDAGGADIGRLFNAYYRTGQQQKMLVLLDSTTKKTYSNEELSKLLSKLDFGYDMKLSGASQKENSFVLTYSCQIAQTKVVKQLKVVVENDTARIAPKNLMNGEIFH